MRHRRGSVLAAALLVVLVAAGCDPPTYQMEIQVTLHRHGLLSEPDGSGSRTLVLTGVSQCTRDEPVDLFPTLEQGAVGDRPAELSVPCGPDEAEWSASFAVVDDLAPGDIRVDVEACTNPGDPIDEDCVSLGRVIAFAEVP